MLYFKYNKYMMHVILFKQQIDKLIYIYNNLIIITKSRCWAFDFKYNLNK